MPSLDASERASLPNSAFAYIDSQGRRMLPIHDQAHVRNALARFSRVSFEDEAGRDRARMRILRACAEAWGHAARFRRGPAPARAEPLPGGIVLKSLGTWRLHGLRDSVELLQVHADDLGDDFPAPRLVAQASRRRIVSAAHSGPASRP
jgi:hypothetical protein